MAFQVILAARWLLIALVMVGTVPLIVANYQFLLVAISSEIMIRSCLSSSSSGRCSAELLPGDTG